MLRSGNPTLQGDTFSSTHAFAGQETMTIQGTVNKTFVLLGLTVLGASWAWTNVPASSAWTMPAALVGFGIALVTVFKKEWAAVTGPLYALVEGVLIGSISYYFQARYPGIVQQATGLTFGTLFSLLLAYKSGLIRPTENFKLGVAAATGGICLLYLVSIGMSFFGKSIPFIHESTPIGIGFSIFVVIIASLNLVMDFDFIERGAESGAPKHLEWYGAFSLMVTLIWLYIEILRLLAKSRNR